jgi:hypothetical protein
VLEFYQQALAIDQEVGIALCFPVLAAENPVIFVTLHKL